MASTSRSASIRKVWMDVFSTVDSMYDWAEVNAEAAFREGTLSTKRDRQWLTFYIWSLYQAAYWYLKAHEESPQHRGNIWYRDGISYLVASHRLATMFQTNQTDATVLLRELKGDDEVDWPAPYDSPLFAAVKIEL